MWPAPQGHGGESPRIPRCSACREPVSSPRRRRQKDGLKEMKAPRDLAARRDPWAQSVARALTPPAFSPAFAIERDLSDPGVWEESIWRSQRRREAMERQLNFGPVTGKRVAVPLAMLAAGLAVKDATAGGDAFGLSGIGATDAQRTASVDATHHRTIQVKPATV